MKNKIILAIMAAALALPVYADDLDEFLHYYDGSPEMFTDGDKQMKAESAQWLRRFNESESIRLVTRIAYYHGKVTFKKGEFNSSAITLARKQIEVAFPSATFVVTATNTHITILVTK